MFRQICLLGFLLVTFNTISCQEYKVVQTALGKIRGIVETIENQNVFTFLGIPYAKPPVGKLRFRKPQPYGSWQYTLDATKDTSPCMQLIYPGGVDLLTNNRLSEDCLFLNIHVPRDVHMSGNRDVMLWIHGGGFLAGQGSFYNGSYLALNGNVIVVTINYRLGAFGFLSTFDDASKGNYGLYDQILAMQWVKSNIAAFGGNPSSITIFGESAGGMSVSYQTLIPYNKGLFQRAIAHSGTSLSVRLATDSEGFFNFLSEKKICNDFEMQNSHSLVECLRQKSADSIQNITDTYIMGEMGKMDIKLDLLPCLDGELFRLDPVELYKDKNSEEMKFFQSLDYMAGTTDSEGSALVLGAAAFDKEYDMNSTEGIPTRVLCEKFAPVYANRYFQNATGTAQALCDMYTVEGGDSENIAEQANQIANMTGDIFFVSPTVQTLLAHNDGSSTRSTYHFLFTRGFDGFYGMPKPNWFKGSMHGSELPYFFGIDELAGKFKFTLTDDDYKLQDQMVKYWSNFAKTGNPNSDSLPTWKQYGDDQNFLRLDHVIKSDKELFADRMNFLHKEMPKLVEKGIKTKQHDEL